MKQLYKLLATGLGSGYIKGAPGTYGSVVGVALYLAICGLPLYSYILFCLAFILFAIWITDRALPFFEGEDPQQIVIDEIAGFLVTMIGHPFSWLTIGLGFVFFRLFDIIKPQPVRYFDRKVKGPWGIVLDDVFAGIYAWACVFIIGKIIS